MKKTQFIELLHIIGKTWVSFVSIMVFVALGVSIFLGIHWSSMAVAAAADKTYGAQVFHSFDISSVYGITEDDLADIAAVSGVSKVEGGYTAFATFHLNGEGYVARLQSLTSDVDTVLYVKGTPPTEADEIAFDDLFADTYGIDVGDTITFDADDTSDADGMRYLNGRTYRVTALIKHPAFISNVKSTRGMTNLPAGTADCFIALPKTAFSTSAFDGCYSNAYVLCQTKAGISTFSDEYTENLASIRSGLDAVSETDGSARFETLCDRAQSAIDEGQKRVDDGETQIASSEQKIAEGEAQIADGEAQIAAAEQQIADGEAQAAEAEAQLDDGEAQAAEAEAQLDDARSTLDYYQSQVDTTQAQIDDAVSTAADALSAAGMPGTREEIVDEIWETVSRIGSSSDDIDEIARNAGVPEEYIDEYSGYARDAWEQYQTFLSKKQELADSWDEYYASRELLDEKEAELADGRQQLAEKETELEDAKSQLADSREQLAAAKVQLADGKVQLAAAKVQLADGKTQLQDTKEQLDQMVEYGWNITDRSSNLGTFLVSSYMSLTDRLRLSMASLFLIIGLLVCYTAVSRMAREQMVSIGTKKALGLREREITVSYLLYSAIAVIIGTVLGAATAFLFLEGFLNAATSEKFSVGTISPYFSLLDTVQIGLIELVLICLATWLACKHMLRNQAVDLLKGSEPPKNRTRFYERWAIWDRMPLYSQSIINNFFNDKLRVAGTLVGIAGCTALVVTAMTVSIDVDKSFTTQYADVYSYDAHVILDSTVQDAETNVLATLERSGVRSTAVMRKTLVLNEPDGGTNTVTLEVPEDDESFLELYHLNSADGGRQTQLSDKGVWISEAYAIHQNAKVGDTVKLTDTSGTTYELPIAGIFEYHLNHHELVMSKALYEETFHDTAGANRVLISLSGVDENQLVEALEKTDGFFSYTNDYQLDKEQYESYQSLTHTMVYIYLALSALMAFMVLLNLTFMFIDEKKNDLIVLMINGFSVKDAKRYIYRDNIVLTIVGIILGMLLGMLMGYLNVLSIETSVDSYILTPSFLACVTGAAVCAVFALVVNLIALRRIPRFDLTDINKI